MLPIFLPLYIILCIFGTGITLFCLLTWADDEDIELKYVAVLVVTTVLFGWLIAPICFTYFFIKYLQLLPTAIKIVIKHTAKNMETRLR